MVSLTKLRALDLAETGDAQLPRHLSAASGLVCPGDVIYVVADNELHLGAFAAKSTAPGRLIRLFEGELPVDKTARKKRKPDLEAITQLPAFGNYPNGALLALGSGSKRNRRLGALLALDAQGVAVGTPRIADFAHLFDSLDRRFPALNIEGAVVSGGVLRLLQRGNRRHPENAVVRYPLPALLDAIQSGAAMGAPSGVDLVDLGSVDGVPLTFTDGASLPDGSMVFTAVAEDTGDSYNDGACVGAAIGIVGPDGALRWLERLDACHKVEGVAAQVDGDVIRLLLVTDADDRSIPASLFSAAITNLSP